MPPVVTSAHTAAATRSAGGGGGGGSRITRKVPTAPAWVPAGAPFREAKSPGNSPSSSREGLPDSRGARGGYLGADGSAEGGDGRGLARQRSPLKRLQEAGAGAAEMLSPKPARCDDRLIEMAVEGGEELSLLSRSISSFAQFLPLPASVKAGEIRTLNLHYNQLRKMEALDALPSLTELKLSSNEITRMEGISKLFNLRVLDLSCNRLRGIECLESLTSLQRLILAYNAIRSLDGLRAINGPQYGLRVLDLTDNRIGDLEDLRHLQVP